MFQGWVAGVGPVVGPGSACPALVACMLVLLVAVCTEGAPALSGCGATDVLVGLVHWQRVVW